MLPKRKGFKYFLYQFSADKRFDIGSIPKKYEDQVALENIRNYYSPYLEPEKIKGVDMSEIVRFGGALNCISWTIKCQVFF